MNTRNNSGNAGDSYATPASPGFAKHAEDGLKPECSGCPIIPTALFGDSSNGKAFRFNCAFHRSHVSGNQVLFSEASSAEQVFALRSGLVKIVKSLEDGKERIIRMVFPGALLGLEALSANTHLTSAFVLRDSEICVASRDEFLSFLRVDADIALNMIFLMADEVAQLSSEIINMSFKDARTKVATLLRSLCSRGESNSAGALTLPFSSQEIGEILELSPETVSRAWSSFRRDGLIEKHGRKVVILDQEALERAARR
jgi:CRP/FNR family transcriptional regulator, anaerobic regulatory protein